MKDSTLPVIEPLLQAVRAEYSKPVPPYEISTGTAEDRAYIQQLGEEQDQFDELGLKQELNASLVRQEAQLLVCTSVLGKFLVVLYTNDYWMPPFEVWWRLVRLICPKKPVRVAIFAHPRQRLLPPNGTRLKPEHINGGYTNRCDPQRVVIYRKEEATRVLAHELFHANCSDPYHKDTPFVEADTEAWAELVLAAVMAKGNAAKWTSYWRQQLGWALRQAATLRDKYHVDNPRDYAWRYGVGRLDVWRKLGLSVPIVPLKYQPIGSLRLTIFNV